MVSNLAKLLSNNTSPITVRPKDSFEAVNPSTYKSPVSNARDPYGSDSKYPVRGLYSGDSDFAPNISAAKSRLIWKIREKQKEYNQVQEGYKKGLFAPYPPQEGNE